MNQKLRQPQQEALSKTSSLSIPIRVGKTMIIALLSTDRKIVSPHFHQILP